MADEYSDEEFTPDDAEPAYEAEFDADEEIAFPRTTDEDDPPENEVSDAYQESYDAEFEPPDVDDSQSIKTAVQIQPISALETERPTLPAVDGDGQGVSFQAPDLEDPQPTEAVVQIEPPNGSESESRALSAMGGVADVSSAAETVENANPTEPAISSDSAPHRGSGLQASLFLSGSTRPSAPARRSSEPYMVAPVMRRSSEPRMMAALPEIERCVDPEIQARLIRRSSSPRVRPAPISRLSSVGELSAASPDDLQVPTNAITEEAAKIVVGAVASELSSPGLLKRNSSMSFVPRLPSLREISSDLVHVQESGRIGAQGSAEDDEVDDHQDNDDGEEDEVEQDEEDDEDHRGRLQRSEEEGGSEQDKSDAYGVENGGGSGSDILNGLPGCETGEYLRGGTSREDEDDRPEVVKDIPAQHTGRKSDNFTDNNSSDSAELPSSSENDDKIRSLSRSSSNGEFRKENRTTTLLHLLILPADQEHGNQVPVIGELQCSSTARSTPSSLSEDLGQVGGQGEENDRLQQIMAEVGAKGVAFYEMKNAEYSDDEADYAVEIEEESRRETQHILQEANALISQQPSSVNGQLQHKDEQDAIDRYGDEDHFSDTGYGDEDEELVDGAYYDSDHDETGNDTRAVIMLPTTPHESNAVLDQIQSVQAQLDTSSVMQNTTNSTTKPDAVQSPDSLASVNSTKVVTHISVKSSSTDLKKSQEPTPPSQVKERDEKKAKVVSTNLGLPQQRQHNSDSIVSKRTPEVPTWTPKAPVPRQKVSAPVQSPRVTVAFVSKRRVKSPHGNDTPRRATQSPTQGSQMKTNSPAKLVQEAAPPASPTRESSRYELPSPPRKAPVYKQKRSSKSTNAETIKKLKPVKCPPNLRIDLPHVDKQKREWLLLNMFRHGDNIDKYEPFISTTTPQQTVELHLSKDAMKRPMSASQIYGAGELLPRHFKPRGAYSRGGRKIVDAPVDPRLRERERSWVSSTPSVSVIPPYDSILDKYCKTVTSPVVQRHIYETRMDDLSPQLAMVLEKRAFKEWKHSETEGFGAVSNSYKTAIVTVKDASSASTKSLLAPRPPASPATPPLVTEN